jgi:hypothetical protein
VNLTEPSLTGFAMATVMLAKMCGWNEPEKVNAQSIEVKVDAALIEQLRAGYAEMSKPALVRDCAAVAREQGSEP